MCKSKVRRMKSLNLYKRQRLRDSKGPSLRTEKNSVSFDKDRSEEVRHVGCLVVTCDLGISVC